MRFQAAVLIATSLSLAGCHKAAQPAGGLTPKAMRQQQAAQMDGARRDLAHIPLPSKALYLSVNSLADWQNPSLTVQENMFSLHVLQADANPSDLGKGTMLRPEAARRQILNIEPGKLAEALAAIPAGAWPYGRVIAIAEANDAPQTARPQLRRNIEGAVDIMTDIGIVAEEWSGDRPVGVR